MHIRYSIFIGFIGITISTYAVESAPFIIDDDNVRSEVVVQYLNDNYHITHRQNPNAQKHPENLDININDNYIHSQSYIQNPFLWLNKGGGTQYVSESTMKDQNFAERLFADGTWDVYGYSGIQQNTNRPVSYNISSTLFGQTGSVAGFSLGGAFVIGNPFIQNVTTSEGYPPYVFMTSEQYNQLSEGYLEYQYSHIVQADVGFIGINNSPFLAANYYSDQSSAVTYQGGLININPGDGWLLTVIGINGAAYPGTTGFTGNTLYNPGSIQGIPTGYDQGSNGTLAMGAIYYTPNNLYNVRLWSYHFDNYANLVYADNSIKFPIGQDGNTYFTLGGQGGTEWGNQPDILGSKGLGIISSNFWGAQAAFNYNWFSLTMGYEDAWGPENAFGHGAIVSPYTYNENVDPMYANSWMTSLVQKASSGQMYIITPTLRFMDNSLSIAPSYSEVLNTVADLPDQEADLVINYSVAQIKGLKFFGVYAYMWQPNSITYKGNVLYGHNIGTALFMAEYLY